jgi:hypothetical protein
VCGGRFKAEKIDEWDFKIVGPTGMVQIAEQVIAAREAITRFKKEGLLPKS